MSPVDGALNMIVIVRCGIKLAGNRDRCSWGDAGFRSWGASGMIDIVRIALRRPYTFVVLALLILIIGPLSALRTPVDIFPEIRIPVIAVVWQYTGLAPDQMSGRVATQFQRALTTTT